jgi:hypothetical protein
MKLSILIPAYHEERTVFELLHRLMQVDIESMGFDKEVVVCDDASRDGTAAEVERFARQDPRVRLVRHATNRGKGAAVRSALAVATGHLCVVQDADLEYDVEDYRPMLAAVQRGAGVVYGSRFLQEGRPSGMRVMNYIANRVLTLAANLLFGLRITDEATCLKLLPTELLRSLQLSCDGFDFCPEVTAALGNRGTPIVEVPVSYVGRSVAEGKKIRWTDGVRALWVLVARRLAPGRAIAASGRAGASSGGSMGAMPCLPSAVSAPARSPVSTG